MLQKLLQNQNINYFNQFWCHENWKHNKTCFPPLIKSVPLDFHENVLSPFIKPIFQKLDPHFSFLLNCECSQK